MSLSKDQLNPSTQALLMILAQPDTEVHRLAQRVIARSYLHAGRDQDAAEALKQWVRSWLDGSLRDAMPSGDQRVNEGVSIFMLRMDMWRIPCELVNIQFGSIARDVLTLHLIPFDQLDQLNQLADK